MKRTTLANHIEAFKEEALLMLRFQLAYNRISKFKNIQKIGRSDLVDQLISLKAIENDLAIRICKFDDDTKGVHSFKKAVQEIPDSHLNKIEILEKIKLFSFSIKDLKTNRRHTKLAHLKIGMIDGEYDLKYNFVPIISLIIEIIDLINCAKVSYNWNDGSHEKFDLRIEVLNE